MAVLLMVVAIVVAEVHASLLRTLILFHMILNLIAVVAVAGLSGLLDPNPLGPHNLVDLRRLGRLFARVTNGLELLKNAFAAYVR